MSRVALSIAALALACGESAEDLDTGGGAPPTTMVAAIGYAMNISAANTGANASACVKCRPPKAMSWRLV